MDDCPECPECPQENTGSVNNEVSKPSVAEVQAVPDTTEAGFAVKRPEADTQAAASSVAAPGFGVLLDLLGTIIAAKIKR
ncbi:hypothetical protein Mpsy_2440 [Methanolobus psychrophilus R15]|nr:hypothetical protein Mpsy_2440 [Methanolobus psychrophilus R15]